MRMRRRDDDDDDDDSKAVVEQSVVRNLRVSPRIFALLLLMRPSRRIDRSSGKQSTRGTQFGRKRRQETSRDEMVEIMMPAKPDDSKTERKQQEEKGDERGRKKEETNSKAASHQKARSRNREEWTNRRTAF